MTSNSCLLHCSAIDNVWCQSAAWGHPAILHSPHQAQKPQHGMDSTIKQGCLDLL